MRANLLECELNGDEDIVYEYHVIQELCTTVTKMQYYK